MQLVSRLFVICCYFCRRSLVGTLWNDSSTEKAPMQNPNWGTWVVRLFRPGILPSSDQPFMFVCWNRNSFFFFPEVSPQPFLLHKYWETHCKPLYLSCILFQLSEVMKPPTFWYFFEARLADWFVFPPLPRGGTESSRKSSQANEQHTQPWIILLIKSSESS